MGSYSFLLFARPSFAEGVGRLLDFGNALNEYNYSETPGQADMAALWADWFALAEDMKTAIGQQGRQLRSAGVSESITP
jgi:hypothetical protein